MSLSALSASFEYLYVTDIIDILLFQHVQYGDRLSTSDTDVYRHDRCQILLSKVVPCAERGYTVKLIIFACLDFREFVSFGFYT